MTPGEIARGLSKAQREALLRPNWGGKAMRNRFARLGMITVNETFWVAHPLGLAVRAIIEQESRGE